MALYVKTNWMSRLRQYANRLRLTPISGGSAIDYDVEQIEGTITQVGIATSPTNMNKIEQGIYDAQLYGSDTGGDDTYVVNLSGVVLEDGKTIRLLVTTGNTGACTLSIDNGVTTKNIKYPTIGGLVDLSTGDIPSNSIVTLVYDGTQWQLQNFANFEGIYNLMAWKKISETTLGSNAASVSFTSIPSGYKYLKITYSAKNSSSQSDLNMTFNDDAAAHYNYQLTYSYSSSIGGSYYSNQNQIAITKGLDITPYTFTEILIRNIASDQKRVNIFSTLSNQNNLIGGYWTNNTNEINKITFTAGSNNIAAGGIFTLWGVS